MGDGVPVIDSACAGPRLRKDRWVGSKVMRRANRPANRAAITRPVAGRPGYAVASALPKQAFKVGSCRHRR
ncbi:hypothetical protein BN2475_460019 [Paraburkholderia ribeironis]|uniref:Uncharacterized protein n=1 Tax=Paraburkholderia ribeironis TaxID=1247936 RepID=A0A1N7S9H6_9BURK|nr:hypothetical protein BN2475_460019 [Paraburkholderia ribeironis]